MKGKVRTGAPAAREAYRHIRAWIDTARLVPGDRLPPERALSRTLGLSRAELRKGLTIMELQGELQRRVGRGTFLRRAMVGEDPAGWPSGATANGSGPLDVATLARRTSAHEAMVACLAVEPQVAGLAAQNATDAQLVTLSALLAQMRSAPSWGEYEALDARFHNAVGDASGHPLLAEMQRLTNAVRVEVVWSSVHRPDAGPPPDDPSFAEHEAILGALMERDRGGAAQAMEQHLRAMCARLTETSAVLAGDALR